MNCRTDHSLGLSRDSHFIYCLTQTHTYHPHSLSSLSPSQKSELKWLWAWNQLDTVMNWSDNSHHKTNSIICGHRLSHFSFCSVWNSITFSKQHNVPLLCPGKFAKTIGPKSWSADLNRFEYLMGKNRVPGVLKYFKQSIIGMLRKDQEVTNWT